MADIFLSEAEKTFIIHGVKDDFRNDGRTRKDYRPMELETGIVSHASGSARLRLAKTDILVGVKTEIDVPFSDRFNEGKIEFFVDCSANATPEFEGRGGEELGTEISHMMQKAYSSSQAFDLKTLCIMEHQQCWKLYVDILILECGGNLFDAVSLAVKAALFNTKIPKVTAAVLDGGCVDLALSDDPHDCDRINVQHVPILVTLCKIGDDCLVDPSAEEEECSRAKLVIGISCPETGNPRITATRTSGTGSLHHNTLMESLKLGCMAGDCLNRELMKILEVDEQQSKGITLKTDVFGFLK